MIRSLASVVFVAILSLGSLSSSLQAHDSLLMVVMDPLSKPLSCDCVRGYAQRDYQILADRIADQTGHSVDVQWYESLVKAKADLKRKPDLIIGKDSVVRSDAVKIETPIEPIASLTGKDGKTTQRGYIVVRAADAAKSVQDLKDYVLLFGPTDAAEKSSAIEAHLSAEGVDIDAGRKRFNACSEAAAALLELPEDVAAAAVISSYAEPLLEGCGTIKKGDLRVVSKTDPVPFVTAFVGKHLEKELMGKVKSCLLSSGTDAKVLIGLETLAGFVPYEFESKTDSKKKLSSTANPIR